MAPTMKASMARDFERGKPSELEALTGAIVRLGEAKNVPVPANRVIYAVLKLRAWLHAQSGSEAAISPGVSS
jgi:2-dehydropantoate 2-reductase